MFMASFQSLRELIDTRFEANEKLLNERAAAQQLAMSTALTAAEQAVDAALSSAEKATEKSEKNAEIRFESFRIESGAQGRANAEKLDEQKTLVDTRLSELSKRLDLNQGQGTGADKQKATLLAIGGFIVAATALIVRFLIPVT